MQRKKSSPKSLSFSLNPIPGMNHTIREMEKHGLSPREVAAILVGGWLLGVVASALMAYGLAAHRTGLFSIGLTGQLISLAGPWSYLAIRVFVERAKKKRKK
ncbi:MAG: hypothetical protein IPJ89_02065 [Candidatus Iainarchaeum archaeon]|uniref:Uncharacterized protein n=1 Tax=Candidatus Iainarchaeum sp. TaxID=3101447 RepID=A0A7T9I2Q3_9ARCH|nr:MAG: hypothetical protein IPJ89_02065 [Candidatus Diapherotrites archaeon]